MSTADLSGNSATRAKLHMPSTGIWTAEVWIERAVVLTGPVVLTVAELSLVGHIYRGEPYQGGAAYRIEGGRGGWRLPVRARSHQDDSLVRLSAVLATVLADMPVARRERLVSAPAAGAGTGLAPEAERRLGDHWLRPAGLASLSLGLLTVPWWILPDGSTFAGKRAAGPVVDVRAEVMEYEPERRRLVVGTETPEAWVPGLTYRSSRLASPVLLREVTILAGEGSLRVEVLG